MEATTFVIVVLAFWSFIATIILFQKNTELLEKLANLETRIAKLEAGELQQVEVPVEKEPPPKAPAVPVDIERVPEVPHKTTITSAQTPEELTEPVPVEPQPSQPPHKEAPETVSSSYKVDDPNLTVDLEKLEFRSRIEKQFIDNWAGILGSIIMVMGAAFLSIYAALKMAPFYRFLMLTGFAGLLFTVFFVLRTRSKWLKLAQWLRSSGCAVFLFGCLGSGYIPGLKWIDSPVYALGLLLIGVLLNLVIGTISGNQLFTSFHSIISLTALAIAPQSQLTLAIAVSISLLQVFITYRGRWEYHLLVSITVFLAYHLYWAYSMHLFSISPIPPNLKLTGIAATAVLGIATAFVHYRELYGSRSFDGLPFIVHLLNWFYMAAGFYLYSTGSKWNTFVLAAASLAAFFLSRRAKTLAIRWLFITDTLIAQTLALLAVFTLQRWDLGGMAIAMALMVEVMIFLTMMLPEEEKSLQRIGVFLYHFSGIFLISGTLIIIVSRPLSHLHKDTGILALSMAIYTVYHIYLVRRKSDSFDSLRIYGIPNKFNKLESYSLGGIITGLLGLVLCALVYDFQWFPYVVAGVLTVLFLLCRRCGSGGLQIGMLLLTFGSFDFGWYHILYHLEGNPSQAALYGLPFLVIAIAGARTSFNEISGKYHKALWIYLFSIHMVICSQTVLDPLSIFATGTAWLVLAPVYLESARFISRRDPDELKEKGEPHRFLFHWGYIFILLFILRHLGAHLGSDLHIGGFRARLLVALAALAVFIYWGMKKKTENDTGNYKSQRILHPLMWELAIAFSILTAGLEVRTTWHPVAWVIGAFLLFFPGHLLKERISRFRFYALFLYWAGTFHIILVSLTNQSTSLPVTHQYRFSILLALVLQLGFILMFYRMAALETVRFSPPVTAFGAWLDTVRQRHHLWLLYPYFLATAFFLYWNFDRSVLTLFWVVEIFAIFTLSILFRENHFRYTAMIGLGACLIRLIFYDLARSDTLTRAMVFLGVGILMILMNSLYNKYRHRFRDD